MFTKFLLILVAIDTHWAANYFVETTTSPQLLVDTRDQYGKWTPYLAENGFLLVRCICSSQQTLHKNVKIVLAKGQREERTLHDFAKRCNVTNEHMQYGRIPLNELNVGRKDYALYCAFGNSFSHEFLKVGAWRLLATGSFSCPHGRFHATFTSGENSTITKERICLNCSETRATLWFSYGGCSGARTRTAAAASALSIIRRAPQRHCDYIENGYVYAATRCPFSENCQTHRVCTLSPLLPTISEFFPGKCIYWNTNKKLKTSFDRNTISHKITYQTQVGTIDHLRDADQSSALQQLRLAFEQGAVVGLPRLRVTYAPEGQSKAWLRVFVYLLPYNKTRHVTPRVSTDWEGDQSEPSCLWPEELPPELEIEAVRTTTAPQNQFCCTVRLVNKLWWPTQPEGIVDSETVCADLTRQTTSELRTTTLKTTTTTSTITVPTTPTTTATPTARTPTRTTPTETTTTTPTTTTTSAATPTATTTTETNTAKVATPTTAITTPTTAITTPTTAITTTTTPTTSNSRATKPTITSASMVVKPVILEVHVLDQYAKETDYLMEDGFLRARCLCPGPQNYSSVAIILVSNKQNKVEHSWGTGPHLCAERRDGVKVWTKPLVDLPIGQDYTIFCEFNGNKTKGVSMFHRMLANQSFNCPSRTFHSVFTTSVNNTWKIVNDCLDCRNGSDVWTQCQRAQDASADRDFCKSDQNEIRENVTRCQFSEETPYNLSLLSSLLPQTEYFPGKHIFWNVDEEIPDLPLDDPHEIRYYATYIRMRRCPTRRRRIYLADSWNDPQITGLHKLHKKMKRYVRQYPTRKMTFPRLEAYSTNSWPWPFVYVYLIPYSRTRHTIPQVFIVSHGNASKAMCMWPRQMPPEYELEEIRAHNSTETSICCMFRLVNKLRWPNRPDGMIDGGTACETIRNGTTIETTSTRRIKTLDYATLVADARDRYALWTEYLMEDGYLRVKCICPGHRNHTVRIVLVSNKHGEVENVWPHDEFCRHNALHDVKKMLIPLNDLPIGQDYTVFCEIGEIRSNNGFSLLRRSLLATKGFNCPPGTFHALHTSNIASARKVVQECLDCRNGSAVWIANGRCRDSSAHIDHCKHSQNEQLDVRTRCRIPEHGRINAPGILSPLLPRKDFFPGMHIYWDIDETPPAVALHIKYHFEHHVHYINRRGEAKRLDDKSDSRTAVHRIYDKLAQIGDKFPVNVVGFPKLYVFSGSSPHNVRFVYVYLIPYSKTRHVTPRVHIDWHGNKPVPSCRWPEELPSEYGIGSLRTTNSTKTSFCCNVRLINKLWWPNRPEMTVDSVSSCETFSTTGPPIPESTPGPANPESTPVPPQTEPDNNNLLIVGLVLVGIALAGMLIIALILLMRSRSHKHVVLKKIAAATTATASRHSDKMKGSGATQPLAAWALNAVQQTQNHIDAKMLSIATGNLQPKTMDHLEILKEMEKHLPVSTLWSELQSQCKLQIPETSKKSQKSYTGSSAKSLRGKSSPKTVGKVSGKTSQTSKKLQKAIGKDSSRSQSSKNAKDTSFICGTKSDNGMIATRVPNDAELGQFIQFLADHEIRLVLVLQSNSERTIGALRSSKPGQIIARPPNKLTCIQVTRNDNNHTVVKFTLQHAKEEAVHDFDVLLCDNWGTGDNLQSTARYVGVVLKLLDKARSKIARGPFVVMCSDGATKTGILVAATICLNLYRETGVLNLRDTILTVRKDGFEVINTSQEFLTVLLALALALTDEVVSQKNGAKKLSKSVRNVEKKPVKPNSKSSDSLQPKSESLSAHAPMPYCLGDDELSEIQRKMALDSSKRSKAPDRARRHISRKELNKITKIYYEMHEKSERKRERL